MITAIALAAMLQTAAASEVYKCSDAEGRVEYRDWPCAGSSGEKFEAKDNSYAAGMDLAAIRAQDAAFNARQVSKQRAIDQANAESYWANERLRQQDQAYRDSLAADQLLQNGYGSYASGYLPYYNSARPKRLAVRKVPARGPPPSVPANKSSDPPRKP
jgi:uncharacterized protein YfaQ (DUF2300 family)